jgi:hypothetical protein
MIWNRSVICSGEDRLLFDEGELACLSGGRADGGPARGAQVHVHRGLPGGQGRGRQLQRPAARPGRLAGHARVGAHGHAGRARDARVPAGHLLPEAGHPGQLQTPSLQTPLVALQMSVDDAPEEVPSCRCRSSAPTTPTCGASSCPLPPASRSRCWPRSRRTRACPHRWRAMRGSFCGA